MRMLKYKAKHIWFLITPLVWTGLYQSVAGEISCWRALPVSMVKELVAFITLRFTLESLQVRIRIHKGRQLWPRWRWAWCPAMRHPVCLFHLLTLGCSFSRVAGVALDTGRVGSKELCRSQGDAWMQYPGCRGWSRDHNLFVFSAELAFPKMRWK